MVEVTLVSSLAGGLLIGVAASLLLVASGRIAGISGIIGGLLDRAQGEIGWRVAFLAGLLSGGFLLRIMSPGAIGTPARPDLRSRLDGDGG